MFLPRDQDGNPPWLIRVRQTPLHPERLGDIGRQDLLELPRRAPFELEGHAHVERSTFGLRGVLIASMMLASRS
ncbi:hypothetical protein BH18ACT12_BH18ACT12_04860 [soil metagenome]